jgi:hypothetical protein
MYTVGARTATVDAFSPAPALVQSADGQYVPANPVAGAPAPRAVAAQPVALRTATAPRRVVYRDATPTRQVQAARERVSTEDARPRRSWQKSALIIGGSAASGAGVGAIVGGKKGALIGAALGGGASSIYEATRR